jgi:acyl-coenzyme A thioesterase PaaI-like protein
VTEQVNPGSPDFAKRLAEIRDAEPSERRAELHRLADGARGVLHRLVQTSAPLELISAAADDLERLAAQFAEHASSSIYEGFAEAANAGEPFAFFDHSPMLGKANPLAPPIVLRLEDDHHMAGTVTFGAAYEGPPGCVHGGFVAAAFDEVLGATQSLSGAPGMTARLSVDYRSPTPLHTELRFVGRLDQVDGRKIHTSGELWAGKVLCAEAQGLFISIDFSRFADLKARRAERQTRRAAGQDPGGEG